MFQKSFTVIMCSFITIFCFGQNLDEKQKDSIFINVKDVFSRHYHFKEKVKPTIEFLTKRWHSGYYSSFKTITTFKDALSQDLKTVCNDQHLNLFYTPSHLVTNTPFTPNMPWGLLDSKFLNNGLNRMEILAGDVGYLRIQAFGAFEEMLPAAFTFLSNTQALIIDIRGNGGGMPSNYVSSYLLPEDSIHLITIYWNDRTDSIYTQRFLNGPRYLDKPVYILTDKTTFSSAEEFAYDLQALKRVTVIGEKSGGGANPGGVMPVYTFDDGSRLEMYVSLAHVENAITKQNWEGIGVKPDVPVPANESLRKAHTLAIQEIMEKEQNTLIKKRYMEIKTKVEEGEIKTVNKEY